MSHILIFKCLVKELDQWDQFGGVRESNSLNNIRADAWKLRREEVGDSISMEVVLEEFVAAIR